MQRFPFLNSFRLVAALGVFVQHIQEILHLAGLPSFWHLPGIKNLGGVCVTAFFALSGFLISYILVKEKLERGSINFKRFYRNRILRIWPLYFLALLVYKVVLPLMPLDSLNLLLSSSESFAGTISQAFFISPWIEWLLLLLLLPHLLLALGKVFFPTHFWSIGVEETFYLLWPLGIEKAHNIRRFFVQVIVVYLGIYALCLMVWAYLHAAGSDQVVALQVPTLFLYSQRISCMAIGALMAEAIIFKRSTLLAFLRHKAIFVSSVFVLVVLLWSGFNLPILAHEIYALLFSVLILNLISWQLEGKFAGIFNVTERWGDVSYGIYMYHPLCIIIALDTVKILQVTNNMLQVVLINVFAISLTFLVSHLSFLFFEQKIMKRYRQS